MNKIKVYQSAENGKIVLGVDIQDPHANLQDLLDVWQPLCDDTLIRKEYALGFHDVCKGCQVNCCQTAYVIPDIIAFKKIARELHLDQATFIEKYFQPEKVTAGLLRLHPNHCVFLKGKICSIYAVRSLLCRFYICTPLAGATEELIYKISWTGAAATQIYAESQGLLPSGKDGPLTSFDQLLVNLLKEYQGTKMVEAFLQANDYKDVPLEMFLP